MLMVLAHHRAHENRMVDDTADASLVDLGMSACAISRLAAKCIAAEMDRTGKAPIELGEMLEDIANVFLTLSDTVRLRQANNVR